MRPWSDELDLYAKLLNLDEDEYKRLIAPAKRNPKLAATVRRFLRLRLLKAGINPDNLPFFVLPHGISPSDYVLGRAKCGEIVGDEVGFSQQDIQAGGGIGFFGIAGQGKSTLVKLFILQFLGKRI